MQLKDSDVRDENEFEDSEKVENGKTVLKDQLDILVTESKDLKDELEDKEPTVISQLDLIVDDAEKLKDQLSSKSDIRGELESRENFESTLQDKIVLIDNILTKFTEENSKFETDRALYDSNAKAVGLYEELLKELEKRRLATQERIAEKQDYVSEIRERQIRLTNEIERQERQRDKLLESFLTGVSELELILENTTRPPFNLAVMVNPATGAIPSRMLSDFLCNSDYEKNFGKYQTKEFPWLISLASENDIATKRIFGIGTSLGKYFSFNGQADTEDVRVGYKGPECVTNLSASVTQDLLNKTPAPFVEDLRTHYVEEVNVETSKEFLEHCVVEEHFLSDGGSLPMIDGIYVGSLLNERRLSKQCNTYIGTYPNVLNSNEQINPKPFELKAVSSSDEQPDYWIVALPESIISCLLYTSPSPRD